MNYAPQIVETFKASAVERILIVDDAYDPPAFDSHVAGALVGILTAEDLREHVTGEVLCEEDREAAVGALNDNEWDDDAIAKAVATLYGIFRETRADAVDPAGSFAGAKGAALEELDPLRELLRRCGDEARVQTVGTDDAAITACRALRPNLIVMDFFLSPPERTSRNVTKGQEDGDRVRSITLLTRMLSENIEGAPAVVLMSSREVAGRKEAYRTRLGERVTSLRFGYLQKRRVHGAGRTLTASGDAADVLIDTSGSFEFGRTLEAALRTWKTGAEEALQHLYDELRDFDIKDFAYLLRLRLYGEGEAFADYLEWFLGESLRAIVDEKVEWTTDDFRRLDERRLTEMIEGAHPLPSGRVAEFFHRMRLNSWKMRPRRRFALGDVFVGPDDKGVRMVISQDCDLVEREGKRAASRILTIGGEIRTLEEDGVVAGELFFYKTPKAIQWHCKDLMMHEFGEIKELNVDGTAYAFVASLRPMYAQTIQKAALADLARIPAAVPPSVHVGAPVRVYVRKNVDNHAQVDELEGLDEARAQVFLPRGGRDVHKRALFTQKFVRDLLARLEGMEEKDLFCDHRQHWRDCVERAGELRWAMLRDGLQLPGEAIFKLVASVGTPRKKSWLEIVIDVADEALLDLHGTDPLER